MLCVSHDNALTGKPLNCKVNLAEINLFRYHCVPKMKLNIPIAQNFFSNLLVRNRWECLILIERCQLFGHLFNLVYNINVNCNGGEAFQQSNWPVCLVLYKQQTQS